MTRTRRRGKVRLQLGEGGSRPDHAEDGTVRRLNPVQRVVAVREVLHAFSGTSKQLHGEIVLAMGGRERQFVEALGIELNQVPRIAGNRDDPA